MPEWSDCGVIVNVRKYAETGAVVTFFTQEHGRHNALCSSVFSKRNSGTFQIGNLVQIAWNARLEEHLGTAKVELLTPYAAAVLADAERLSVLASACALLLLLPEREPNPDFFEKTVKLLAVLPFDGFWEAYARWEVDLLSALGFGLDLSVCALTGTTADLCYVSPKSGRAVCREAGAPWADKLLSLPAFLTYTDGRAENREEIKKALKLTGFFLENYGAKTVDYRIPTARNRLIEKV